MTSQRDDSDINEPLVASRETRTHSTSPSSAPVTGGKPPRGILFWLGRTVLVLLLLLIILVPLVRYVAPPLAISWLKNWYAEQGDQYQLQLADWQLSLWSGTLALNGIVLDHPGKDGDQTSLQSLTLDVNTGLIKDRTIEIEDVSASGLTLQASMADNTLHLAGLELPLEQQAASATTAGATSPSEPWRVMVDDLTLSDWNLNWQQPGLSSSATLKQLTLANFDSENPASFDVTTSVALESLALDDQLLTSLNQQALVDTLQQSLAADTELKLTLEQPFQLDWSGRVTQWNSTPGVVGDLTLGRLELRALNAIELGFEQFSAVGIEANASQQASAGVNLTGLHITSPNARQVARDLFVLEQYQLDQALFDGQMLQLGKQTIKGLKIDARLEDERLNQLPFVIASADTTDSDVSTADGSVAATQTAQTRRGTGPGGLPEFRLEGVDIQQLDIGYRQSGIVAHITSDAMNLGVIDSAQNLPIELNGSLDVQRLEVEEPQSVALLQPLNFRWYGQLRDWRRQPQLVGDVVFEHFSGRAEGQPPLSFDSLSVEGISADRHIQSAERVTLSNLVAQFPDSETEAVKNKGPLLSLASYVIPKPYFDGDAFTTGVQTFAGLKMNLVRLQDGRIAGTPVASDAGAKANNGGTGSSEGPVAPTVNPTLPILIRVDGVELLTENAGTAIDSRIEFEDQAIQPNHRSSLQLRTFTVGQVDSNELLGNPESRVPVNVLAGLDKYNDIKLDAKVGLSGGLPEGNFNFSISQMNLPPFSPYVSQAIGYKVQKGMLQLKSNVDVVAGQMDGKATLRLQNSKFEPANQKRIDRVSKQISMPVETVLSVLKDDNNNLKIDIPIDGPINDPGIGINDILQQVTKTAVRTATLYYLQQAFQPYGALISLGSMASDTLFAIRLEPLKYQPQQSDLTSEQTDYLQKVVSTMKKKTALELQVCPFVSKEEAAAMGDQWFGLGIQRGENVKDWLSQFKDDKDKSLSRRITVCSPEQGKDSRVEMGF